MKSLQFKGIIIVGGFELMMLGTGKVSACIKNRTIHKLNRRTIELHVLTPANYPG